MNNPFEAITERLSIIENLLLEIRQKPFEEKQPENCTIKETAQLLKVSEQSIHNYVKRGFLPAQKLGRILLVKRTDIDKALKEVKSLKYKRN